MSLNNKIDKAFGRINVERHGIDKSGSSLISDKIDTHASLALDAGGK